MKKIFIALFFGLTVCSSFAQSNTDSSKHLVFKGIPLDGTLAQYVAKMKQSGFKQVSIKEGLATLQGDFAGYKDCYVGVSTLTQKDLVHKIAVLFSERDSWATLSANYFNLKEMLTEKYDKPSEVVEKFDGYSEPKTDELKMYAVKSEKCKYYSTWETNKGDIQLSIEYKVITGCFVTLIYIDKINGAAIKKLAIDDL